MNKYLFTSESVSEGHPDKVSDQISDALLDEFLKYDPNSKVACETLVTTGLVVCAGEVRTNDYIDIQKIVRETISEIGYTKAEYKFDSESCGIITTIHGQSNDIYQGVARENPESQGAGDQGMMFGYATNESENYMPLTIELSHLLLKELSKIRREGIYMSYLRPDSKSQVTIEYEDNKPVRIDTIVISTQHDEDVDVPEITEDIKNILLPRVINLLPKELLPLFNQDLKLLVNPTGKFVIGGPHGDTGLTGRKIIVDTYGGKGAHGGGCFSGKDSSKVDRSAAYAARHIAKNLVASGVANEVLIQVAYAIGVAEPVGFYVNTYGTGKYSDNIIAEKLNNLFDMRPYSIVKRFELKNPIYGPTASYGHFGRDSYKKDIEVYYEDSSTYKNSIVEGPEKIYKTVEFFPWEKLDYVDKIKELFLSE
jgi:S-adenosylmethionine synthetase